MSAKFLFSTSRDNIQRFFLSDSFEYLCNKDDVLIDVSVDGLKLFKNSDRLLWPILGKIVGFDSVNPFMIGYFSGIKKPQNVDSLITYFCSEVRLLRQQGLKVGHSAKMFSFVIRLFICDSPARAFVTGVISHNSKKWLYKERRVCSSKEVGIP